MGAIGVEGHGARGAMGRVAERAERLSLRVHVPKYGILGP